MRNNLITKDITMWKSIPNFPDYEVSSDGLVRSWRPRNGRGSSENVKEPVLLTVSKFVDSEYLRVSLRCPIRKKHITRRVHQLVLEAFVGPIPKDHVVMHLNDDPTDNHLSNLKYGTPQQNLDDMVNKGRSVKGENHPRSLCSDELRKTIITLTSQRTYRGSKIEIANELNIPINTVRRVVENYNLKEKGGKTSC